MARRSTDRRGPAPLGSRHCSQATLSYPTGRVEGWTAGPTYSKCLFTLSREKSDSLRAYFAPQGRASSGHFSSSGWSPTIKTLDPRNCLSGKKHVHHFWFPAPNLSIWFLQIKCPFITQLPVKTQGCILSAAGNSHRFSITVLGRTLDLPADSPLPVKLWICWVFFSFFFFFFFFFLGLH